METEYLRPDAIEKQSFSIIEEELFKMGIEIPSDVAFIVKRAIHATADFDYASSLYFSRGALDEIASLINEKVDIVTDTNMALSGINKGALSRLGIKASCFMSDEDVIAKSKERGVPRAVLSMEKAVERGRKTIFVIGNAPTAMIRLWQIYNGGKYRPDFVIGVPVGFVNVEYAKELIMDTDIPCIVNRGRKGGSNVAAAITNAILYHMGGR